MSTVFQNIVYTMSSVLIVYYIITTRRLYKTIEEQQDLIRIQKEYIEWFEERHLCLHSTEKGG